MRIVYVPRTPSPFEWKKTGSWCCGNSDKPNGIFHLNFGNEKPQRLVCSSSLHNWPGQNGNTADFPIVAITSRTRDYYKPIIIPGRRLQDLYRWQCRRERADRDAEEIALLIALAQRHAEVLRASRFAEDDLESRSNVRLRVFHVSFLKRNVPLLNRTVLTLRIANPWSFVARITCNNSNNGPVHQSQCPSRIPRNPCGSNPPPSAWPGDWTIKTHQYDKRWRRVWAPLSYVSSNWWLQHAYEAPAGQKAPYSRKPGALRADAHTTAREGCQSITTQADSQVNAGQDTQTKKSQLCLENALYTVKSDQD